MKNLPVKRRDAGRYSRERWRSVSLGVVLFTVCEYPAADQSARCKAEAKLVGLMTAGFQSRVTQKSVLQFVTRSATPPEHVAKVLTTFEGL